MNNKPLNVIFVILLSITASANCFISSLVDQFNKLPQDKKEAIYLGIASALAAEVAADNLTDNEDKNYMLNGALYVAFINFNKNKNKMYQYLANTAVCTVLAPLLYYRPDTFTFVKQ